MCICMCVCVFVYPGKSLSTTTPKTTGGSTDSLFLWVTLNVQLRQALFLQTFSQKILKALWVLRVEKHYIKTVFTFTDLLTPLHAITRHCIPPQLINFQSLFLQDLRVSSFPHNVRIFGGTHPHQLTFCMCVHARSLTVENFNLPLNHARQQAKRWNEYTSASLWQCKNLHKRVQKINKHGGVWLSNWFCQRLTGDRKLSKTRHAYTLFKIISICCFVLFVIVSCFRRRQFSYICNCISVSLVSLAYTNSLYSWLC